MTAPSAKSAYLFHVRDTGQKVCHYSLVLTCHRSWLTMSDRQPTIQLVFQPTLKVAGEVIDGAVHLNFPGLSREKIEEVHVKLRCVVDT